MAIVDAHLNEQALKRLDRQERFNLFGLTLPYLGLVSLLIIIPIGWLFFHSTKLSYEHFGFTWNIRMIGFGVGTLVFGVMSYLFLREIPTLKTAICLLLALSIILIQVTNVIGE